MWAVRDLFQITAGDAISCSQASAGEDTNKLSHCDTAIVKVFLIEIVDKANLDRKLFQALLPLRVFLPQSSDLSLKSTSEKSLPINSNRRLTIYQTWSMPKEIFIAQSWSKTSADKFEDCTWNHQMVSCCADCLCLPRTSLILIYN